MEIYTCSYDNCKNLSVGISISGDGGKRVGFSGPKISKLAPKLSWWTLWHENIGCIPEDENLAFYIERYYDTVLKPLSPGELFMMIPRGKALLCYERPEDFCHREILAAYLELYFGFEVREVFVNEDGSIKKLGRNKYYKTIKDYLEELIKGSIDMCGHECIAAAYAFSQALYLEKHPDLCDKFPVSPESYRRLSEVLESDYAVKKGKRK